MSEYEAELSVAQHIAIYACRMKHAGYAHPDQGSLTLRLSLAKALEARKVNAATAIAVFVLAHEEGHVEVPTNDETRANDFAEAHFNLVARRQGFSRLATRRLRKLCPY